ncbi:MAG: chitin deacetylase, partial [Planctomycetaceae bacterium]
PFAYPDGLIEVPMSPVSDIGAFRTGRGKLDWFLKSIRQCVQWTIENGAVFDFLAHPSCLYVVDPEFNAIELICELVRDAGERAAIVDLNTIAARVSAENKG